jgi:hypothetical protein
MGVGLFEILLRDGRGPAVRHVWSAAQLLHAIARLQLANAQGADVFLRPAGEHGLVLVRGLDANGIDRLTRDGFAPAATVAVGAGRFEAWVKLSQGPLPQEVRRAAAAGLARRCNGRGPVDGEPPFGRLAGFTPPAWERGRSAASTAVQTRDCPGRVAPAAAAYLEHVQQALNDARLGISRARPIEAMAAPAHVPAQPPECERAVRRDLDRG